jgi:hypothetical protein
LEDQVAEAFKKRGYIVFTRRNHCDVLAIKPDMALAYLVECKDYEIVTETTKVSGERTQQKLHTRLRITVRNPSASTKNIEGFSCTLFPISG